MRKFFFALLIMLPGSLMAMEPTTRLTLYSLKGAVRDALLEKNIAKDADVTLFGNYPPVIYENEAPFVVDISFTELDSARSKFHADAVIKTADGSQQLGQHFDVDGRFEVLTKVPVLKRRMDNTEVISEQDVDWMKIPLRRAGSNVIKNEADLIGKSPKHTVSADRVIDAGDIVEPTVVRKGEIAEVFYRDGDLTLRLKAKVMQDGVVGESVQVRNQESGRTFMAVVKGKGVLEVLPAVKLQQAMLEK